MISEVTLYSVHCDGCNELLTVEFAAPFVRTVFYEHEIADVVRLQKWAYIQGYYLCTHCYAQALKRTHNKIHIEKGKHD